MVFGQAQFHFKVLFFFFLFSTALLATPSSSWANSLVAPDTPPEKWIDWSLNFQTTSQNMENLIARFLEASKEVLDRPGTHYPFVYNYKNTHTVSIDWASIPRENELNSFYDHIAEIRKGDSGQIKMAVVIWDTKKTGIHPSPQDALITISLEEGNRVRHLNLKQDEYVINGKSYYRSHLQFSNTALDGTPLQRGVAEIFEDVERQLTKISSSTIEGKADMRPDDMVQLNIQTTISSKGYIFLIGEMTDPVHVAKKQNLFCRNPSQKWVEQHSLEWDENCEPLFENKNWHGSSFSSLPNSYKSFLEN
ncbi:MAG: hypothetical protein Q7T03_07895 [Deltaproteobacteria bacterium]|nr:hypothetical protein [Deltaproteobacteria bacterium]